MNVLNTKLIATIGKTMYLTGRPSNTYTDLVEPLAVLRIENSRELLTELREELSSTTLGVEQDKIIARYQDVEKAIQFWYELLAESKDD